MDSNGRPNATSPLIDRGTAVALTSYEAAGAEPLGGGARYDIGRYEYSTLNNTLFFIHDDSAAL